MADLDTPQDIGGKDHRNDIIPTRRSIPISDFHSSQKPAAAPKASPKAAPVPEEKPVEDTKAEDIIEKPEPVEAAKPAAVAGAEDTKTTEKTEPEDPKTEAAVDDILKSDGDEILKNQDEIAEKAVVMKQSPWERFKNWNAAWWGNPRKRYGTIGAVVAVLVILLAVPFTRYNLLGLILKSDVTVQAVDSKSGKAVSGAEVSLAGQKAQTDANGKAVLHVHAGSKTLKVTKKYYSGYSHGVLVALSAKQNNFKASLGAQGRQVSVKVVNKLTTAAVAGASVTANGATAKTDTKGMATVVLPSGSDTQSASVSLNGYNTAKVDIAASGDVAKNTFSITPAGKLYFLSNLSGKLDVVKTDLDGTNRATVLAGTGNEDRNTTSLLASRDWKYLALLSKRAGSNASVYLIDTTNGDKLSTIDEGNADFSLVGWSGHNFVYQVTRNTVNLWQANRQALKSFNAESGQSLLLDQTQGAGSDQNNYINQYFGSPYVINDQVIYAKNWQASYNNWSQLPGKAAELASIGSDGSGHKTIKSFNVDSGTQPSGVFINTVLYEPDELYIYFPNGAKETFYVYADGKVTEDTTMTSDKFFNTPYPTFLLSPSGNNTFWADQRDGKNTLFVGDKDAKNQKQVASLSDYNTYGWYTDDYLLVSKNSSELYAMSSKSGGTPYKITDYYKPAINYNGYGGGYGGR